MLILKENSVASVPTPPAGKDTFFIDDSGTPSVKNSAGTTTTFPTTSASNAQVLFMNGTAITGDAQLTYNYNTDVLTVTGNVAALRVLTDNLLMLMELLGTYNSPAVATLKFSLMTQMNLAVVQRLHLIKQVM